MVEIRRARKKDCEAMLGLIQELAVYEEAEEEVEMTVEMLMRDGFGDQSKFESIVAESDGNVLGLAIYYERYSTWKGATLFLEDLIVHKEQRGQGIGKMLLKHLRNLADQGGYKRLEWQVLDWNRTAIDFYKKFGAEVDPSWHNCRIRLNEGI